MRIGVLPDAWMKMCNYNPMALFVGSCNYAHQATIATGYARMPMGMVARDVDEIWMHQRHGVQLQRHCL